MDFNVRGPYIICSIVSHSIPSSNIKHFAFPCIPVSRSFLSLSSNSVAADLVTWPGKRIAAMTYKRGIIATGKQNWKSVEPVLELQMKAAKAAASAGTRQDSALLILLYHCNLIECLDYNVEVRNRSFTSPPAISTDSLSFKGNGGCQSRASES